jgi:hypothetical protein
MNARENNLRALVPYALVSGLLFGCIAGLVTVLGVLDLIRSLEELPSRFFYSAAMSLGFATSLSLAAFFSFTAGIALRKVDGESDESLNRALVALIRFFRAFYPWLIFLAVALALLIFSPVY